VVGFNRDSNSSNRVRISFIKVCCLDIFINIKQIFNFLFNFYDLILLFIFRKIKGRFINIVGYLRKNIECFRKLQDALIAQIRGGFINIVGYLRKKKNNIEYLIKLQDAPIAQNKRRIYKLDWDICGRIR
jgi:hypothetical protein